MNSIDQMPERSVVYDRHGKFFSRLSGENRKVVPFDQVSNDFINALLAREDSRFYNHVGVDPIGIARALVRNLLLGGIRQGGSTISQQLARNIFPLGGKNFHRNLLEAALSFRIETELSKERILECYMNRIYFGSGYYGIETACQAYFQKPASQINLSEAALLAGLIRSPTRLSPFNDVEASITQRNSVLKRMHELGLITSQERLEAMRYKIAVNEDSQPAQPQENWAMDTIRRKLENLLDKTELGEGGLSIFTSIDPVLQEQAERALQNRLIEVESRKDYTHLSRKDAIARKSNDYLQAATLALDNSTGGILMIVGGRDYYRSKFNRALLAHRQLGSVVKPFFYAQAFAAGLSPGQKVEDAALTSRDIPRQYGSYRPSNADGKFGKPREARDGLIYSRNTMSIRIGMKGGIDKAADLVIRSNLNKNPKRFPSLFLGAFESDLLRLTSAYTVFPNRGNMVLPWIIDRVVDAHGNLLYRRQPTKKPLLEPRAAGQVANILQDVLTRGTGRASYRYGLRRRAAGKTGTTNNWQDAWFVGFTSNITCGVWVGFDKPRRIAKGAGGSQLALPIWVDIVESAAARNY
ncbi:MAG: transglycosylase domain-containing protein [Chthoniobacterales bacterium]